MTTAGLYDESGEFSVHIGVPDKSGVGKGLMVAAWYENFGFSIRFL
ncbi:hypothetical protein RV14_GL000702 [Enterococcus ratti]|uniref:glutaminase n=1 Tax=Enterococcus ratti TaxID=150033 RepID=A0A1L8WG92_9ENTE|nr:hypothetical protein RV14_GL000702 [Enterococcus ratti]